MGFHVDSVKYGANEMNPKVLLQDPHPSTDAGEIVWYAEPHFRSGSIHGTFRHTDCKRFGESLSNHMCNLCASIPHIDTFRLKLQRRCEKDSEESEKTNYNYLSHETLAQNLRHTKKQFEALHDKMFFLSSMLVRTKKRSVDLHDKVRELSRRGDVNAIGFNLRKAYEDGKLKDKAGLVSILQTVSNNLCKKKQGKRFSATSKDFYEVLLTLGGPRLCSFVSSNLNGPHIHTALDWRSSKLTQYVLGDHQKNVIAVAELYKKAKDTIGLSTQVPCIMAEDETAIIPRPEYQQATDLILGFCGVKGADHVCEDVFTVRVGDDNDAYDHLRQAFINFQVATHARVIMVNPLHSALPKIVLLLQANCNRFTHNEVLHQWLVLESLCKRILEPVLGPVIGHASDGDSRRRKLMLNQASGTGSRYQPIPTHLGFIMSAKLEITPAGKRVLRDLFDQDSIHNDKKIINPLDHPTRILRLGRYSAHMNHLRLVMQCFLPSVHGLRVDDVNRKDRQKWESVQRLKFLSVQKCLLDISQGTNGVPKDPSVYGTWAFLNVAWHYTEIYFSLHTSLYGRVKNAAFVALFFSIWRNWILITPGLSLKKNFLTRECFQDVLLSCHFVVILISYFRDEFPDLECALNITGTDCCERYFSENGSFVQNKHNYTFLEMLTNLGFMNRLQEIRSGNTNIQFPKRKHNNDFIWDKQFPEDLRKQTCNLREYPSHQEVIHAWKEGLAMAQSLARELGMEVDESDESCEDSKSKEWFYKPMDFIDFKESLKDMATEEEVEKQREDALQSSRENELDTTDPACPPDSITEDDNCDARQVINPLLGNDNESPRNESDLEHRKHSTTIWIPDVGRRYKTTVVAEMRNNPELSTDRLRRVRGASVQDAESITDNCHSLGLFDDCAFKTRDQSEDFVLGHIQRIRKKGQRGYVEYTRNVDLNDKPSAVEVLFTRYRNVPNTSSDQQIFYQQTEMLEALPLESVICKVDLRIDEANSDVYKLLDIDVINRFIQELQVRPRSVRQRSEVQPQTMADDGRRVDVVQTASGRTSRRVSYLF